MALSMHKHKTITKSGPPKLMDLCHDSLVRGLITKHEKLPDSVLDIFKGDPSVMQQLTALVAESSKREAEFHGQSVVAIIQDWDGEHDITFARGEPTMAMVKANELPYWLLCLLEAYHAMRLQLECNPTNFRCETDFGYEDYHTKEARHESTLHQGYVFHFGRCTGFVCLWDRLVKWTKRWPDEEVVQKLFWELCHKLFHLFGRDHEHEYGMLMRQHAEGNVGNPDFFAGWSNDAIAEFFQKRTRKILRNHIKDICKLDYVKEWFNDMGFGLQGFEGGPSDKVGTCALQPVPYMTLNFNFPLYGGWDDERSDDDSGSDDDHNAFA